MPLFGNRKSQQPDEANDPIGDAKRDVTRLRALAIHVCDPILQGDVHDVCQNLSKLLQEAQRSPGTLASIGPSLCITKRLKESLDLWLRLSQKTVDTESAAQMQRVKEMFHDLRGRYAELAERVEREDLSALKAKLESIAGVLEPQLKLPKLPGRHSM
jgi:hypothetical protein